MIFDKNMLILYEFERVDYNDLINQFKENAIHSYSIEEFKCDISKLNNSLGYDFIQLRWKDFRTLQYVGIINLRHFTLQIVPKIFKTTLQNQEPERINLRLFLLMLNYTESGLWHVDQLESGQLNKVKDNLFDFYILFFSSNLKRLLLNDLKRTYESNIENLSIMKGKFLLQEHLKRNVIESGKYMCQYDEYQENNQLNQILKFVVSCLRSLTTRDIIKNLIDDILRILVAVDYRVIKAHDFDKLSMNRLTREYKPFLDFCRLFIQNSSFGTGTSNNLQFFHFIFDMNKLFEQFLTTFILKNQKSLSTPTNEIIEVNAQKKIGKLYSEFFLMPDLIIKYRSQLPAVYENRLIIDFKYKVLDENKRHEGLSQADFYQMFAYSISQKELYPKIFLIYPLGDSKFSPKKQEYLHDNGSHTTHLSILSIDLPAIFQEDLISFSSIHNKWNQKLIDELKSILNFNQNNTTSLEKSIPIQNIKM